MNARYKKPTRHDDSLEFLQPRQLQVPGQVRKHRGRDNEIEAFIRIGSRRHRIDRAKRWTSEIGLAPSNRGVIDVASVDGGRSAMMNEQVRETAAPTSPIEHPAYRRICCVLADDVGELCKPPQRLRFVHRDALVATDTANQ